MYNLLYSNNFESFRRITHITIWEKSTFLGLLILLRLVYFLNFLEDCVKSKLAFEDCVSQWKDLYFQTWSLLEILGTLSSPPASFLWPPGFDCKAGTHRPAPDTTKAENTKRRFVFVNLLHVIVKVVRKRFVIWRK